MKTINKQTILTILSVIFMTSSLFAQLKIRNDAAIQIGYEKYRYLSFGIEQNSPNNGKYAIEHFGVEGQMSGLNFWKPWPTAGYANFVLFLRDDRNVGLSTTGSSEFRLDVSGDTRSFSFNTFSDERLKSNIMNIENPLKKLLKLRGVTYLYNPKIEGVKDIDTEGLEETKINTFKQNESEDVSKQSIGFIAQEVKEILPEIVTEDENGYLSMNYDAVIPLLVEAIKEQQTTISKLNDRLSSIENNCCLSNSNRNATIKDGLIGEESKLYNNTPNPFSEKTEIKYYLNIDDKAGSKAAIIIYDLNGRLIDTYALEAVNGNGVIAISSSSLRPGSYVYSLTINEELIDSKIMIKIAQ